MTGYHIVEPEVAGGWGKNTEFTRTPGQPVHIHKAHYEFDAWLGDELLESTPFFIVTQKLATAIEQSHLTGATFGEVETSKSERFRELYPHRELPKFRWLKIDGSAGRDDFGLTPSLELIVSDRALAVLERAEIPHASIEPFAGRSEPK